MNVIYTLADFLRYLSCFIKPGSYIEYVLLIQDDYTCRTDSYSAYNCSSVTSCATSDGESSKYIVNDVTYACGSCETMTSSSKCVINAACSNAKMSPTENELLKSLMNEKLNNLELNLELMDSIGK